MFRLHVSAVTREGGVILFLGESGQGKSTLAQRLPIPGSGINRLTDDISPLRVYADHIDILPDFPQLKLPASEQTAWRNQPADLTVRVIYSLNRMPPGAAGQPGISRRRIGPAEAFSRLTAQNVASRLFTDGLLRRHVRETARMAELAPIYELSYPSGKAQFDTLRDFLLDTDD